MTQNAKFTKQSEDSEFSLKKHKEVQHDLLQELSTHPTDCNIWANKLWAFQEAYGKILYSELSTEILEEPKELRIRTIQRNLERLAKYIGAQYPKGINFDQYQFWLKYNDHCQLAILQRKHYNLSKNTVKEMVSGFIKSETNRIQKDLTSQLIGLVTMFTALSFVIFGGTQMLSSILDNIRFATVTRLICVGFLWTLCMSMLFYMFVWFIIKIMKPNENDIFSDSFKKKFWTYIEILMAILFIFTVLSLVCPKFFALT